jgi:hypothetical protein
MSVSGAAASVDGLAAGRARSGIGLAERLFSSRKAQ